MAYTTAQLQTFFTNANAGTAPTAAQTLTLTALANQNSTGTLTDAQALAQTIDLAADSTTAVSIGTYQFFTGSAPSQAGLAYLNQAFTGTGIQANLNGENRFIAQSVALALGNSAAKTAFTTAYGSLSIADATKAAYNIIVGNAAATAAGINVDGAVAFLTSTASIAYYTAFVKANVAGLATASDAEVQLAVKAAIVGEILYQATVFGNGAGVGSYATATTNLLKDLADDGNLAFNNASGVNILTNYGASGGSNGGVPGSTTALTSGIDTLNGTANDDTFNAVIVTGGTANADLKTTISALDTVNGGAGNDILNIVVTDNTNPGIAQGNVIIPAASVSGVETINIRSLSSAATETTTVAAGGFTGATQFVSDRGTNALVVTGLASGQAVGANGLHGVGVALTGTYGATAASAVLNLTGGVIDTAGNATTTATLNGAGVTSLTVNSTGAANSLGAVTIGSGNVQTITVNAGVAATLGGITGFGAANAASTAAITVNGNGNVALGGLTVGTAGNIATLNVTTGGGTLNLGAVGATAFAANAAVNVSGAASTTSTTSGAVTLGDLGANVKTINASGLTSSGVNVTIGNNAGTVFTGGAGTDVVTIAAGKGAALTGAINAGAGNDIIAFTTGADIAANLTSLVTGFETLRVSANGAGADVFDPTLINGVTSYQIGASTKQVTLSNLVASSPVAVIGNATGGLVLQLKDASGANDALTVTLNNGATTGANVSGVTVSSLTLGGTATAGQIETLNIVSSGRNTGTGTYNNVTIGASGVGPNFADANKYVITGSTGLQLTTGTAAHSISIDGSAAGPLNIVATGAVTGTQTIITGAANDTINTGTNVTNLYAGAGGDAIILGLGGAASGVQTVVYKAATDSLLDLTGVTGASLTGGTVNVGKMDTITNFVTGQDKLDISALGVSGALTAGIVTKAAVSTDAGLTAALAAAGLFSDGISTRGLAQIAYGADNYVIVDVNKNGSFDAASDLVIKLVGVTSIAAGDFVTTN